MDRELKSIIADLIIRSRCNPPHKRHTIASVASDCGIDYAAFYKWMSIPEATTNARKLAAIRKWLKARHGIVVEVTVRRTKKGADNESR